MRQNQDIRAQTQMEATLKMLGAQTAHAERENAIDLAQGTPQEVIAQKKIDQENVRKLLLAQIANLAADNARAAATLQETIRHNKFGEGQEAQRTGIMALNAGNENPKKNAELESAQGLYKLWTGRLDDLDKAMSQSGLTPEIKQTYIQKKAEALAAQDPALKAVNSGLGKYAPGAMPPPAPPAPAQTAPVEKPAVPPDTSTLSGLFRKTTQGMAQGGGRTLGAIGDVLSTVNKKTIPFLQGKVGTYTLADGTDADLSKWADEDIKAAEQQGLIKNKIPTFTWPQGTGAPGVR